MVDAGRIAESLARTQTIIGDKGESDARIGAHLGAHVRAANCREPGWGSLASDLG